MRKRNLQAVEKRRSFKAGVFILCAIAVASIAAGILVMRAAQTAQEPEFKTALKTEERAERFPVSVNPHTKEIAENPFVLGYFDEHVAIKDSSRSWRQKAKGTLALMHWYQNLASLSSRTLIIQPGERKEQVAHNFGKIMDWDDVQKKEFIELVGSSAPKIAEGKFQPGSYTIHKSALPSDVASLVLKEFENEVLSRYSEEVEALVPLADTLIIASLLEREAFDFEDMRKISGVIWNRLFIGMKLQIDATLQYAKGSRETEPWWPRVRPADKYIPSPYNTYKHEGLPPASIANASVGAIIAALNPKKTDCLYYFHDRRGLFHCAKDYAEHIKLLKQYYGRGT
jgi:UPF0755 protein